MQGRRISLGDLEKVEWPKLLNDEVLETCPVCGKAKKLRQEIFISGRQQIKTVPAVCECERQKMDAEKAAAQAEAERLAAEATQAADAVQSPPQMPEKSWADQIDHPDFVFAWWMIPVALATCALSAGLVRLLLHSAKKQKQKYVGKYVKK